VDKIVGLQHTIVALTADHGVAPVPESLTACSLPGGRMTNKELLERQWSYVKDHVFEKIPNASDKGFKLIFDMLSPRNPKVAALRTEDVFDASYVKELIDKGFFK